jgi:hypothetical protein
MFWSTTSITAHSSPFSSADKRRAIKSQNRIHHCREEETMNATQDNNRSRQGRIPATLQAVFLASNRGKEVNKPPPAAVASKVFFRNWLFQRQTGARKEKAGLFAKKNKKSKRSKNQPQKPILQERVAQTPKVKVCKAESPCTVRNGSRLSMYQHYVFLCLAHTRIFFS